MFSFCNRSSVIAATLAFSFSPSLAFAVDQWTFSRNVGDDNRIAYTTCDDPEIWQECVVLDIGCNSTEGKLSIMNGGAIVARTVSNEQHLPTIAFTVGSATVLVPVYAFNVRLSELDGSWAVEFTNTGMTDAFKVIQAFPNARVSVAVGNEKFNLTPSDEARLALVDISNQCAARD